MSRPERKRAGRPAPGVAGRRLDERQFEELLLDCCVSFARAPEGEGLRSLLELYGRFAERVPPERRLKTCLRLQVRVEEHEESLALALLPFIHAENDSAVISSASLSLASLLRLEEDDETAGPRWVAEMVLAGESLSAHEGRIGAGLLLLGDRRLAPLWRAIWERLDVAGRCSMAKAWSGFATAAHVDFLLEALERERDDGVFGALAGTLGRFPLQAQAPLVVEVERALPATPANRNPLRVLGRWTIEEYGERLRPRLERLLEVESEPRVLGMVIEAWS